MNGAHKLPLLKQSLKLLVEQLRPQDTVSMVTYAGAIIGLQPTSGSNKNTTLTAIDDPNAGASQRGNQV